MPKFRVDYISVATKSVTVEAKDEDQAVLFADETLDDALEWEIDDVEELDDRP